MSEYFNRNPIITRPKEQSFPGNVMLWRRYTGLRVLALFIFIASMIRLAETCYTTTFKKFEYQQASQARIDNRGLLKKAWANIYWYLWDRTPEPMQVRIDTGAIIRRRRYWSLAEVVLAWFTVWLAFDWDKARHFVFAALSLCAGIVYSLMPVDAIPDFIPVAGVADDIVVNIFSTGLGAASVAEYYRCKKRRELATRLLARHPDSAVEILLEEYGLERTEG